MNVRHVLINRSIIINKTHNILAMSADNKGHVTLVSGFEFGVKTSTPEIDAAYRASTAHSGSINFRPLLLDVYVGHTQN